MLNQVPHHEDIKGKVVPELSTEHHTMKAYWGNGGIAPHILDLSTRWRWVVNFMPWPLYSQGKNPWYPLDRRLGEPRAGLDAVVKKIPSPCLDSNLPIIQPIAQHYTTELSGSYLVDRVKVETWHPHDAQP
jgi:hypothetical protein